VITPAVIEREGERAVNIVMLCGVLSRAAVERDLPSGQRIVGYEVTTRVEGEPATTVPVVWQPPAGRGQFDAGEELVVTGQVRRRFFRSGGALQSRTEVVADAVVRRRDGRAVQRALERAVTAAASPPGPVRPPR
jgi:single-strand DNA-binding protein